VTARGDGSRGRHRVSLANRQRAVAVRAADLRRMALRVLRAARPAGGELSVVLVDDAAITELNATYRGNAHATDVLSFSQLERDPSSAGGQLRPAPRGRSSAGGQLRPAPRTPARRRGEAAPALGAGRDASSPPEVIGDVVISMDTACRQAEERGRPLDEEVGALLVHGVLHLLGYDHERSASEATRMFAREREVAEAAGLPAVALGDRPRRPASRPGAAARRRHSAQGGQR
jgi:probable rRNA maturation factor